jgi:flagellar biosynthesis component FlhA
MVFEVLSGAFVATFVLGLLPGMRPILFISMAVGLALAGYAAYLRKLKLEEDAHGSRGKAFLQ